MDEYIEQLLAEIPDPTLHDVVKNILDEPIPEAVKERLLKPLKPGKYRPSPPPQKLKERKRKAIVREFDPNFPSKTLRTTTDYQKDVLELVSAEKVDELIFRQTRWVIGNYLRGWQMDVPQGNTLEADPRAFLDGVRPQIHQKLTEEILDLNGVKFQLAMKVQLSKANQDGTEEYTDPVLQHKQEATLQAHEINEDTGQCFPQNS